MSTQFFAGINGVLNIVSVDKLLDYYGNPQLLEDRIKQYVEGNWADKKYANSISLDKLGWHSDLVKLINKWVDNEPKDYDIIDKWCSLMDYALLKEGFFKDQYPDYNTVSPAVNAVYPTTTDTIEFAPHWRVVREGVKYQIMIGFDTKDLLPNFNHAICRLFLSHLFYGIHAGYDQLESYKIEVYRCQCAKCSKPNNLFHVMNRHGRRPTYCSDPCRWEGNNEARRKAKAVRAKTKAV